MKNLMNLKNAKILSKREQKSINGGAGYTQSTCEDAGGQWRCIGTVIGWPAACGCVFDGPVDPPNK